MIGRRKTQKKPQPVPDTVEDQWLREMNRNGALDWLRVYDQQVPLLKSTTRQTAALHLAVAGAPTSSRGLYAGEDMMTGWPVFQDPIQGYRERALSSPNCVLIGDVGGGKSSFSKTWVLMRNLMLGRRVVVVDKKLQATGTAGEEHEGEYAQLSRALGRAPIRFTGPGGVCVNPLDPVITGISEDADGTSVQTVLLKAILDEVMERRLTQDESKALRVATQAALSLARDRGTVATIRDIARYLLEPVAEVVAQQLGHYSVDEYAQWGRQVGFALEECIDGDLAGLIDGETSPEVRLRSGLTVFDISALPDDGPAVPVVMAIINTWLRATLIAQREVVPTYFLVEEGWHLVTGSFARVSQQNTKKSRGLALSTVTNYQHLSDVPADSPAIATIKEAGIAAIFAQAKDDDARECQQLFGLPSSSVDLIKNLERGVCLFKVGTNPAILMRASRSRIEAQFADTDGALLSRGQTSLLEEPAGLAAVGGDLL